MSRWRRGGHPQMASEPSSGSGRGVRDWEQVQEEALSSFLCPYIFVWLCFALSILAFWYAYQYMFYSWPFGVESVKITFLLSGGTRSISICGRSCHFKANFMTKKKWMIYVTVTLRKQNNQDCTSHIFLSLFRQLVWFFNETAMLIEWLEKNTLARKAEESSNWWGLLPTSQRAHVQYLLHQSRGFMLIIMVKMWTLIKIFFHYNHVHVH